MSTPQSPRSHKWAKLGSSRRLLAMRSPRGGGGGSVRSFGASTGGSTGHLFDVVGKTTGQPTATRSARSSPRASPRQIQRTPEQRGDRRRSRSPHVRDSLSPPGDTSPAQSHGRDTVSTPQHRALNRSGHSGSGAEEADGAMHGANGILGGTMPGKHATSPSQGYDEGAGVGDATAVALATALQQAKEMAARFEAEATTANEAVGRLTAKVDRLKMEVLEKDVALNMATRQAKEEASHTTEVGSARRAIARLRRQLGKLVLSSNSQITRLQNQVQAYSRLLKEARLESEKVAEQASAEWEAEKAWWKERVDKLTGELESLKLMQHEDRQQLLREHSEVVKALQVHFDEYRSTAEALFAAEASKLEDKLAVQSRKYEAEIRLLVKSKDAHYNQVVTMKDAKLMNLIEGTDFQNILIKHEHELEAMRRLQDEAVEHALAEAWRDSQQHSAALRRSLGAQEATIAKLRQELEDQAQALAETNKRVAVAAEAHEASDAKHSEQLQRVEAELVAARQDAEHWQQRCRDLRHQMLRHGGGNGAGLLITGGVPVPTRDLVQKVAADAEVLHQRLGVMEDRERSYEGQLAALRQRSLHDQDKVKRLQHQLDQRTKDLQDLTATFHRFIRSRIRQYEGDESGAAPELGAFLSAQLAKARQWRVLTPTKVREEDAKEGKGASTEVGVGADDGRDDPGATASVRAVMPAKLARLRQQQARQRKAHGDSRNQRDLHPAPQPSSLPNTPSARDVARVADNAGDDAGVSVEPETGGGSGNTEGAAEATHSLTASGRVRFQGQVHPEADRGDGTAGHRSTRQGSRQSARRGTTPRVARSTVSTASKMRRTPGTIVSRASRTTSAAPPYAHSEVSGATSGSQVPPRFANTPGVETSLLEGYEVIKRFERRSAGASRARGHATEH